MSSESESFPVPLIDGKSCNEGGRSSQSEVVQQMLVKARPGLKAFASDLLRGDVERRIDASDLVQETLLKGAAQFQQFQGSTETEFFAWLNQILQHNLIDAIRHHTSQKRDVRRETLLQDSIPDAGCSPSSICRGKEDQDRVSTALHQLRADQRDVLMLRNDGLTFDEIGQRMGKSPDAARMLWGRAILMLGKLLKHNDSTVN